MIMFILKMSHANELNDFECVNKLGYSFKEDVNELNYSSEDGSTEELKDYICMGCLHNQPNQLAHMDIGGCLYQE